MPNVDWISGTKYPRELCVACARVAYNSTARATPTSDAKLLRFLISQNHRAVTEFAQGTFAISLSGLQDFRDFLLPLLRTTHGWRLTPLSEQDYALTLNPRTVWDAQEHPIGKQLLKACPKEFADLVDRPQCTYLLNLDYPDKKDLEEWSYYRAPEDISDRDAHSFRVLRIRASRGMMDELFRHRLGSMVGQSTRRVDFSSFEFKGPMPRYIRKWLRATKRAYKSLRELGLDTARNVLPLGLKCSFVYGTTLANWNSILRLRRSKEAHPEFKEVFGEQA